MKAIMLTSPSAMRFAYMSMVLESFLRSWAVLLKVIDLPTFAESLYNTKSISARAGRDTFMEANESRKLFYAAEVVYDVIKKMRVYLRNFSKSNCCISRFVGMKIKL